MFFFWFLLSGLFMIQNNFGNQFVEIVIFWLWGFEQAIIYQWNRIHIEMEFDDYERLIEQQISQYQRSQGKSPNLYKKAKKQLDMYQIHLLDGMAAQSRLQWLQTKKKQLNSIKEGKMLVKDELKVKDILVLGEDINQRMDDILVNTEEAIQVSTYIRIELEKQIQALDQLEDENKEFKKRVKKVKKGLKVIIRRAMLNKITRFLMILVLLAVIALIVVYIVKGNQAQS